jgi:hypothetical protein
MCIKFTIFWGVTPYNPLIDHESFVAKLSPFLGQKNETRKEQHDLSIHQCTHFIIVAIFEHPKLEAVLYAVLAFYSFLGR